MMGKRCLSLVFGAVLLFARTGAGEATRAERLDHGEILIDTFPVAGTDLPEILVTAVIDAAPARVWNIIDHCGDYQRTLMRVKSSRELSRQGTTVRCEVIVDTPWPLPNLRSVTVAQHIVTADKWTRTWTLESGDYKYNAGAWTLTHWNGGRTLIEYRLHSEPNISIPVTFQKLAMKSALPQLIERIRSETR